MKKKIDTTFFASNLRGESVFFPTKNDKPLLEQAGEPIENQRPAQVTSQSQENIDTNSSFDANMLAREDASTRTRVNANTLTTKPYRLLTKQSGISLFKDQQDFLTTYSLEAKLRGEKIGVSQMIRDAIDAYIVLLKKDKDSGKR